MAFRWFRKNDKATKWIYILVTVFVMLTFSITGAMYEGLTGDDSDELAGTFRLPSGREVEVTRAEFLDMSRKLARMRGDANDEMVWQRIMLEELARDEGIEVSDEMIADMLRNVYQIRSQADLDRRLEYLGIARRDFNEFERETLRIAIYQQLHADHTRVRSDEVFQRFQQDNELFKLAYVAFEDQVEREALADVTPSEDELRAFYEETLDENTKKNEFSTPERFELAAALASFEGRTADDLRALLPEHRRDVGEQELERYYNQHKERLKNLQEKSETEDASGQPPDDAEDAGSNDDGDQGDESADAAGEDAASAGGEDSSEGDGSEADEGNAGDLSAEGDGDSDASEDGADDEVGEDESVEPAEDDAYPTLEEARETLELMVLKDRIVVEANSRIFQKNRERKEAEAAKETADEDGAEEDSEGADSGDGEPDAGADSEPDDAAPTFREIVEETVERFGLELVDFPEPLTLDEIENLERVGSVRLREIVRYRQKEETVPMVLGPEVDTPFVAIVEDKIEAEPLPFEEVKERLVDAWRDHEARRRAGERMDAFVAALKAAAREKVESEVAAIEKEALEEAEKEIEEKGVTDEPERQRIRDEKLAARQAEIDELLSGRFGEVFEAVAEAESVPVRETRYFKKSYNRTAFYADEENTVEKFLMGMDPGTRTGRFDRDVGEVFGPLRDEASKAHVIAKVIDRKLPDISQMKLGEALAARRAVENEKNPMAMFAGMQGMQAFGPRQFEYGELALRLNLRRSQQKEPASP